MNLDPKQEILIAIYTEYQKDLPNMKENIRFDVLKFNKPVFEIALEKLQNENLISGANFNKGGGKILIAFTDNIMMTREGINYVEEKLGIEKTLSGIEKVKYISKKAIEAGWDKGSDLAAKVIAELIKQN